MPALLSVVTPVYNPPLDLIEECAHSILGQSFRNFEWIVVDDGSQRPVADALDAIAARDDRVRVVHKENGGVSTARNLGIDESTGTYVTFIDSDDRIEPDFFVEALDVATGEDADLVCGRVEYVIGEQSIDRPFVNKPPLVLFEGSSLDSFRRFAIAREPVDDATQGLGTLDPYTPFPKLYRRETIGSIRFDARMRYGEDSYFVSLVSEQAKRIALVDKAWYHHVENDTATTTVRDTDRIVQLLSGLLVYEEGMKAWGWRPSDVGMRYYQAFTSYTRGIATCRSFPDTYRAVKHILKQPVSRMLGWIDPAQYRLSRKHKLMLSTLLSRSPLLITALVKVRALLPR